MRVDEAGTAAGDSLSPPPPVGTEGSRDNLVQPIRAWPPPPDLATGCDAILGWVRASDGASLPSSCHCIVGIDRYLEPVASNETPVVLRRRLADLFRDMHDATPEAGVHLTVGPFEGHDHEVGENHRRQNRDEGHRAVAHRCGGPQQRAAHDDGKEQTLDEPFEQFVGGAAFAHPCVLPCRPPSRNP